MRFFKKTLCIVLSLLMLAALAACASPDDPAGDNTPSDPTHDVTSDPAPAASQEPDNKSGISVGEKIPPISGTETIPSMAVTAPSIPDVAYAAHGTRLCPVLKAADEDECIRIVNQEIEAQFLRFMDTLDDDGMIQTCISSTGQYISVMLSAKNSISYGTDGEIWGICYDYVNKAVVLTGAFLSELDYSYADIDKNVHTLLAQDSFYEYFDIPFFYFDSASEPVFVVIAIEHPSGADAWKRIFYYSPGSNSFVDSPWSN